MLLKTFPAGPFATNAYLLASEPKAIIIDPAPESASQIISVIEDHSLEPIGIYLTHSHWDHIGDLAAIKHKYDVPVMVHHLDRQNVELPGSDQVPMMMPIIGVKPDGFLEEGQHITLGEMTIEVIHTPGHTPGGICLWLPQEKILFSGDTLFKGSIGNLALPTSDPTSMWQSLKKLAKLPPSTVVYPGHGEPTMIGDETWLTNAQEIFS